MNNAVYGKTIENVREHVDFELADNIMRLEKCLNSPTYKHRHIINDRLIGIEKNKSRCKFKQTYLYWYGDFRFIKITHVSSLSSCVKN